MPPQNKAKGLDINSELVDDLALNVNVKQEVVITTVDKLKICLTDHRDALLAGREWVSMLGLSLSLFATLTAATFSDLWMPAEYWGATYLIAGLLSAAYTVVLFVRAIKGALQGGIDGLIDKISNRSKASSDPVISTDIASAALDQLLRQYLSTNARNRTG